MTAAAGKDRSRQPFPDSSHSDGYRKGEEGRIRAMGPLRLGVPEGAPGVREIPHQRPYHREVPSAGREPQLLDLRGVRCPLNFVRAKMALGRLGVGEELELVLDAGEPADSVPRALRDLGQAVLEERVQPDSGVVRVLVRRAV